MPIADDLIRSHDKLMGIRAPWEGLWERVSKLVMPMMDDFGGNSRGDRRGLQQFDSFAMGSLDKFSAAIEAGLMPRTTMWHHLSTGDDDLDDDGEVKRYLEELNRRIWDARYSPLSNFVGQSNEKRLSLGLLGTGCMLIEAQGRGIRYQSIPLSDVSIDIDKNGLVDVVHRSFEMTARQAVQRFGSKTPDKIRKQFETGKLHDTFEFLHCVQPREDYERGRIDDKGKPIVGYYVFPESKEIVDEEGYYEMPYIVSRYAVSTRERYGRSPAINRIADISMLNEMKRTVIEAAAMTVDPPLLSHEMVSEFDLVPGAMNPGTVDDNGRPLVQAFNARVDPNISRELMADVRQQVDDGFLGIYFRVLLENPNMTATQAMLIAQQQGQMTTPVVGRLQAEWLGPMIRRESGIMYRAGRHPRMPQRLADFMARKQEPLRIDYSSPLTRAAQAEEGIAILRAFEGLAPMAQVDPSVYNVFDMHEAARKFMEVTGVPASVIKSKEVMEAEQEKDEAMAQMNTLLQAAPIAAQTAKTMAEAQQISGNVPMVAR